MSKIKLGLSISLSGSYSIQGKESFEGIKLWLEETNRNDGFFVSDQGQTMPVELVYYDDESSVSKCKTNVQKLITEDRVDILLGPYSSSLALAACEVSEQHNKTLWNHGGSTDEIEERGFNCVINAITPASHYCFGIIDAVRNADPNAKKIAIFSAHDSGFSTRIAKGVKTHGELRGFEVKDYKFASGTKGFSKYLDDLTSYKSDLILGIGRANDDLAVAEFLFNSEVYSNSRAFIVASIKLFKDRFGKSAQGVLSSSQWERGIQIVPDIGPTSEQFSAKFQSAYGKQPDYVAAQGYNIGLIIDKCIAEVGTLNDIELRNCAKDLEINTFYGAFKVDSKGNQTGHQMVVVQWQNGEKVIVYPESLAQKKMIYPGK